MSDVIKKKLKIVGMHCTACAMLIDSDLEDIEGVTTAQTNYHKEETEIEYDKEKVTTTQILNSIENSGYSAKLIGGE